MHYFIGDIHGHFKNLCNLFASLKPELESRDIIVFLGDYIDRGFQSYEVVEFLIQLSKQGGVVCLKGNHEGMLQDYLQGKDRHGIYMINGGEATIDSYIRHAGRFAIPSRHMEFFSGLMLYYEGDDFIAVHAGLNPQVESLEEQDEHDLLWIREKFFRSRTRFRKTVIFGHTPTVYINGDSSVYDDRERNILGIDTGVIFGHELSCMRWPDKKLFTGGV
jgi:serine/threonine protein phosphatase 1